MTTAYIALGSNLGDRQSHLDSAIDALRQTPGISVIRVSQYYETEPVGGPEGQGNYLNAAAELITQLNAGDLLHRLLEIEVVLGRVRVQRYGARTIDLDLLLFGLETIEIHEANLDLVVPHPRMLERRFVLEPLAEIAPLAVHPQAGSTIRDLLQGPKDLAGMRAVITGSTSGIGRAIALSLARSGVNLVIHGRRSMHRAKEVAQEVKSLGVEATTLMADLSREGAFDAIIDEVWGDGIDFWINNAGADTLTGDAARWHFERKLAELYAVDLRATMLLSRRVGERMRERGRGVIVNVGWDQAESGMEGDSGQLFGAIKGAIMDFTKSLAKSLAPEVRVNCVAPGWIRTAWGETASRVWQDRVMRETPLKRWGTPEDVAAAVHWLVSPSASFITGQIIRVNGGAV